MTEFHIIGLGNLCEFVIKNIDEKQTYGTFSACDKYDRKSMQEFVDYVNQMIKENEKLKQELFETSKELLWATSDEVDRALHYEDEVEELRKEIFE